MPASATMLTQVAYLRQCCSRCWHTKCLHVGIKYLGRLCPSVIGVNSECYVPRFFFMRRHGKGCSTLDDSPDTPSWRDWWLWVKNFVADASRLCYHSIRVLSAMTVKCISDYRSHTPFPWKWKLGPTTFIAISRIQVVTGQPWQP